MGLSFLLTTRLRLRYNPKPSYFLSLSTSSQPSQPQSDPNSSLSARMSFVFDQIDAMERVRGAKDDALERIRAWRESKKQQEQEQNELIGEEKENIDVNLDNLFKKEVELVHPWPEWIGFMERLMGLNYFDRNRFSEDQMVKNLPIELPEKVDDVGFDFTRDWATVRMACLNFGKDRFDILRSLSKKDLQVLVGFGCPSTDRKVVLSGKLLRKYAHLDEGDVCSSCKLRSTCNNGFLLTRKEEEARTIDVVRILLTFGFDSINSSVENKVLMENKNIKKTVRKLLNDVTKLSAVPIDPNLPPPVIKRPPPKVKQPPPPPKRRVGRDDIEMKKGDWLCPKCDFMNFAKNVVCLQCDAKRPQRQLLPGEWECPQCNFLNYRRNTACFRCEHRRPPEEMPRPEAHFQHPSPKPPSLNKLAGLSSQSWNFDFDDDESDGADVAAFEFADPPGPDMNSADNRRSEYDPPEERICRGRSSSGPPRSGFDDFDDEDDDVDSYEIDDKPGFQHGRGSADHDDFDDDDYDSDDMNLRDDKRLNMPQRGRSTFDSKRDVLRMNEDRGRAHGRPSRYSQLDEDDDDDDDVDFAGNSYGHRDKGAGFDARRMNRSCKIEHDRPHRFGDLDDDDNAAEYDDNSDDADNDDRPGRGGMFEKFDDDDDFDVDDDDDELGGREGRFDQTTRNGPGNDRMEHKRGARGLNGHGRFSHLDEDDDDDADWVRRGDDRRGRGGGFNNMARNGPGNHRMEYRRGRLGNQSRGGFNNRGQQGRRNYNDDDDDDNDWTRHSDDHRDRGNRFDRTLWNEPRGDDRMDYNSRRGGRGNPARGRSRGGFSGRGRGGGRSDWTGGAGNRGEFGRGRRSNQRADGRRDFPC